jgi:Periplasmic copper-binding protein (NosD)
VASEPAHCDVLASPSGSDAHGDGSPQRPFASLGKLDASLSPGQTGCLRGGTYGNTSTWHQINANGTASARITLTAYPGETPTVVGYVDIEGSYTTISHLRIDGSNTLYKSHPAGVNCPGNVSEPLVITGHDDVFEHNDYFQSIASLRGNGIGVGFWGSADNTVIRYNKIHDVGQCEAYDHLIYLSHGNNVQIYGNWMWNDPHGRGVQLYPAPTNARVFDNVIDHVGEGFVIGNEPGDAVAGNEIYDNVITNATGLRWENIPAQTIHDLYGGTPGSGNVFHDNISYANSGGIGRVTAVRMYRNVTTNPRFVDAANHDYRVQSGSPAASWDLTPAA